jgi:hypothetical protein
MAMGAQKVTRAGTLAAVRATAATAPADLVARIGGRLADAAVELEALKAEVAELAALAYAPRSKHGGSGLQLLTVSQAATLLGIGQSTWVRPRMSDRACGLG